jgi:hypothetical protein
MYHKINIKQKRTHLSSVNIWLHFRTNDMTSQLSLLKISYEKNLLHRWWPQSTYTLSTELCLSPSKILTPHPPLHPASVSSSRTKGGGYTLAGRWQGWGSIFWKTPAIGLASYSTIVSLRWWPRKWKEGFNKTHFLLEQKTSDELLYTKNGSCRGLARNLQNLSFGK